MNSDNSKSDPGEAAHPRAPGAFFGRRKGHALRQHQNALMHDLLPRLSIGIDAAAPSHLATLFENEPQACRLEIGFGGGEHLIAEALAHPRTGFIGCEPYINGMAKILARIERDDVRNLRLFAGDAAELLDWLPAQSLARIDLIHPDPWPKRRHWKRRFVQQRTLEAIARVLQEGGEFRFVSDIDDYCAWTLAHIVRSRLFDWTAERADDWRLPWAGFTPTRYGAKAVREGRKAAYFIFAKRG